MNGIASSSSASFYDVTQCDVGSASSSPRAVQWLESPDEELFTEADCGSTLDEVLVSPIWQVRESALSSLYDMWDQIAGDRALEPVSHLLYYWILFFSRYGPAKMARVLKTGMEDRAYRLRLDEQQLILGQISQMQDLLERYSLGDRGCVEDCLKFAFQSLAEITRFWLPNSDGKHVGRTCKIDPYFNDKLQSLGRDSIKEERAVVLRHAGFFVMVKNIFLSACGRGHLAACTKAYVATLMQVSLQYRRERKTASCLGLMRDLLSLDFFDSHRFLSCTPQMVYDFVDLLMCEHDWGSAWQVCLQTLTAGDKCLYIKKDIEPFRADKPHLWSFGEVYRVEAFAGRAKGDIQIIMPCAQWSAKDPSSSHVEVSVLLAEELLGRVLEEIVLVDTGCRYVHGRAKAMVTTSLLMLRYRGVSELVVDHWLRARVDLLDSALEYLKGLEDWVDLFEHPGWSALVNGERALSESISELRRELILSLAAGMSARMLKLAEQLDDRAALTIDRILAVSLLQKVAQKLIDDSEARGLYELMSCWRQDIFPLCGINHLDSVYGLDERVVKLVLSLSKAYLRVTQDAGGNEKLIKVLRRAFRSVADGWHISDGHREALLAWRTEAIDDKHDAVWKESALAWLSAVLGAEQQAVGEVDLWSRLELVDSQLSDVQSEAAKQQMDFWECSRGLLLLMDAKEKDFWIATTPQLMDRLQKVLLDQLLTAEPREVMAHLEPKVLEDGSVRIGLFGIVTFTQFEELLEQLLVRSVESDRWELFYVLAEGVLTLHSPYFHHDQHEYNWPYSYRLQQTCLRLSVEKFTKLARSHKESFVTFKRAQVYVDFINRLYSWTMPLGDDALELAVAERRSVLLAAAASSHKFYAILQDLALVHFDPMHQPEISEDLKAVIRSRPLVGVLDQVIPRRNCVIREFEEIVDDATEQDGWLNEIIAPGREA